MSQRRQIIKQLLVLGLWGFGRNAEALGTKRKAAMKQAIMAIRRRDDTIIRLPTIGDGYKMTWCADDRQLIVVNDGAGWLDPPERFFKRSLWSLRGAEPGKAVAELETHYPSVDQAQEAEEAPHYHGHGLLAVNGRIYQFMCALDREQDRPRHWTTAKLIFSDDNGRTWRNQDGTHPVRWEDWDEQRPGKFAFFNEEDGCFSLLSILQMGQDYRANRDGYIYVYGTNGNVDGRMNQLVLFRVRIDEILDRRAYQFFAGRRPDGLPVWSHDIAQRQPVHVFPAGWVNSKNLFPGDLVVETWLPSVVFNEPLGLYMMIASGNGCADDGTEFGKASYLGFWVSETPWGPWRQVHEENRWLAGSDPQSRLYSPQISPKWIAADGRSFWLVWCDLVGIRDLAGAPADAAPPQPAGIEAAPSAAQSALEANATMKAFMPRYAFNAQLIELDVR